MLTTNGKRIFWQQCYSLNVTANRFPVVKMKVIHFIAVKTLTSPRLYVLLAEIVKINPQAVV
jgi:hypothetical protein